MYGRSALQASFLIPVKADKWVSQEVAGISALQYISISLVNELGYSVGRM